MSIVTVDALLRSVYRNPMRSRDELDRRSQRRLLGARRTGVFAGRKLAIGAAAVITVALVLTASRKIVPPSATAESAPTFAPDFIFDYGDGRSGRLSSLRGRLVLLSFIDSREHSTDGIENPDLSRRLLVFIQSIRNQYSTGGLTAVLVDGSADGSESRDRLVNFRFDRDLVGTPMLTGDAGRRVVREYDVRSLPTTLLIDREGRINSRWEGLVLPSTLAPAIMAQGGHERNGRSDEPPTHR
jgi:hypothetical protein